MFIDQNEGIDVINASVQQFGPEFTTGLLTDETMLESLFSICEAIRRFSKEERQNIAVTVSKLAKRDSQFSNNR